MKKKRERQQCFSLFIFKKEFMAKDWYKKFLNSNKWKQCRNSYIEYRRSVDGGMCEECRENSGYIVHHTTLITQSNVNDPDIALNHKKMKYVCKSCHDMYEGHGINGTGRAKPLCIFDETGQPMSLREVDRTPP